jgi:oligopeptide transport system permease protein
MTAVETFTESSVGGRSLWQDSWARLRRNRAAIISMGVLCFIILACLLGPLFSPWDPEAQNLKLRATPPGTISTVTDTEVKAAHWFGTDTLGRDLFVRTMHGGRVSLMVGLIATLVALFIGVSYGAVAGYAGGRADSIMMRFVDILYALPFMLFVILLIATLGEWTEQKFGNSIYLVFAAIGAVEWLTMSRIVRAQVQSLAKQEFVEAARSLGLPAHRIIFRHIVPNVLGPVIVYATLTVPAVMLLEAALSFLGLGLKPPASSWGTLIEDGSKNVETSWWLLTFPAAFFSATLFCLNFAGDGLRDAMDVKTAKD